MFITSDSIPPLNCSHFDCEGSEVEYMITKKHINNVIMSAYVVSQPPSPEDGGVSTGLGLAMIQLLFVVARSLTYERIQLVFNHNCTATIFYHNNTFENKLLTSRVEY